MTKLPPKNTVVRIGIITGITAVAFLWITPSTSADTSDIEKRLQALEKEIRLPIGSVLPFAGSSLPQRFVFADGKAIDTQAKPEFVPLCAAIGDQFRLPSDAVGKCRLPDLRGRAPFGTGTGGTDVNGRSLTARNVGDTFGEEVHLLTVPELPAHHHSYERHAFELIPLYKGLPRNDAGSNWNLADNGHGSHDSVDTGGNQPHNVLPPGLALRYIIKY